MQFDQTSIAIRERSSLEVFDLAANVLVRHLQPIMVLLFLNAMPFVCLLYTSPSPRDATLSRMPSSA